MVVALLGREDELRAVDEIVAGLTRAVVFVGGQGLGKTTVLDELAERARAAGLSIHRVHATPEAAEIPLGAVAHMLPHDVGHDALGALQRTESALVAASGRYGAIVLVDDAQDLDPASTALVHALVTGGRVRVALAVDSSRGAGPGLRRLWKDGHARRVDLRPLGREDARTLFESFTGARVADEVERRVWELTAGHPGLVRAVAAASAFEEIGGLLRLTNDPVASPDLRAVADTAVSELTAGARRSLAALAVADRADVELVDAVAGSDATAELEEAGLARADGDVLVATVPLFASVALASLTTRDRRELLARLADEVWASGPTEGPDLVRAVRWRLEAGGTCDASHIACAAEHALQGGDYDAAATLARVAAERLPTDDRWSAEFTLGRALRQLGDHGGAETAFADAANGAPDDAALVDVAVARAHNLGIGAGRIPDALEHLADTRAALDDPVLVRRVAIEQTFLSAVIGDLRQIADAASAVLADSSVDEATAVSAATGITFACTMLLRLDAVERTIEEHRPTAERLESTFPLVVDQLDLMVAVVAIARGRIADAVETCRERRRRGMDADWGCGEGSWRAVETFALTFTCDPELRRVAHRTVVALRSADPLGLRFVGRGFAAVALAHTGAIDDAKEVWSASRPRTEGDRRVGRLIDARIRAWELAVGGEPDAAARLLTEMAQEGRESGHLLWGMLALHDAVRMDRAGVVLEALVELQSSEGATSELLDAIVEHARRLDARDPAGLLQVAGTFERMGAGRLAAETAAHAGRLLGEDGHDQEAQRALARAQLLGGGRLPGPPWLPSIAPALTDRQLEIVQAALDGATSREIADRLTVSVRTVDNHLAAVYRNLGLSGRADLAATVGPSAG